MHLYDWNADGSRGSLTSCHVFNLTAADWMPEDRHVRSTLSITNVIHIPANEDHLHVKVSSK